jgi:hypothetical protein
VNRKRSNAGNVRGLQVLERVPHQKAVAAFLAASVERVEVVAALQLLDAQHGRSNAAALEHARLLE